MFERKIEREGERLKIKVRSVIIYQIQILDLNEVGGRRGRSLLGPLEIL